jgi:hypothetical protein
LAPFPPDSSPWASCNLAVSRRRQSWWPITLRVREPLFAYARKVAEEENVSINQFFVTAIAEKVSALKTEAYFRERRERGHLAEFDAWLAASPEREPEAGDELP